MSEQLAGVYEQYVKNNVERAGSAGINTLMNFKPVYEVTHPFEWNIDPSKPKLVTPDQIKAITEVLGKRIKQGVGEGRNGTVAETMYVNSEGDYADNERAQELVIGLLQAIRVVRDELKSPHLQDTKKEALRNALSELEGAVDLNARENPNPTPVRPLDPNLVSYLQALGQNVIDLHEGLPGELVRSIEPFENNQKRLLGYMTALPAQRRNPDFAPRGIQVQRRLKDWT